eukprot:CAMPEP_0171125508 /NCGR_PEP_ID=MMETSP0766_2-20121228/111378_1 /TAXON_ID=439317 /ORGANISM="Gambierdiscus australes, Strain CAWD 149" /LENGTH=53 /DNA_ID=CAMNT_0011588497 /DNA_START=139 /DNA_END=298 /DNA_ORIENTATION=-
MSGDVVSPGSSGNDAGGAARSLAALETDTVSSPAGTLSWQLAAHWGDASATPC